MAISHDPPSVLIGPGDFHTGPYYIIISGLPERTSWQDVKDFIKSQIPWKLDLYVSIFGKRQDSGWVRVVGFKAFNHVRIRAPFFRDRSLFINPTALADPDTAGSTVQAAEEFITATTPIASNASSEQSYPETCATSQQAQAQAQAQLPNLFPPTPPNTPKASRSISEPSLSGFRKVAITWREDSISNATRKSNTHPASAWPLSLNTQEKMGSQIKSELAPLLARGGSGPMHPLETLECFPGIALATFSSHELARRAIKVLRQSERLNARPVVDEVSSREEVQATSQGQTTAAATAGKKRVGKRRAGAGRTASAPAAAEGGSGAGAGVGCDVGDGFQQITQGKDKETRPLTSAKRTSTTASTAARKTPAVLIVNGSWKI
ncbi:hypothetical protein NEUTE1DRAFT_89512 [Neurospora tetrasperma FGSC 2508]|uniref:RRM domain-containing protein n=1 Tax=Neurospora tetrasperma (strain FGSC 2508 / ATCC MYA-4615 / P0657) TaxID=510951 RepID=F8N3T3_NEUT8|nr:uncharacterized protein NEUTE1DRAFT_89512 [Neurospora tetrasperma FGSC 2508]EGO51783.1 hypothetical protein NEUTE1DRAFT_89512 [Neurospora tetrasperma FGSC 2508]